MTINKSNIAKKVASKLNITTGKSKEILESFLLLIKKNAVSNIVKLPSFGTFELKQTSERPGRNPKTKELYIIQPSAKIFFHASNLIKKVIN